jgi:uncharacterized protein (TIGR02266 family)
MPKAEPRRGSARTSEEAGPVEHRRSDRRYERRVAIELAHEGAPLSAFTRNLSLGGVFIETETALPFGARVSLRFRVPTQAEPIEVSGQVRWLESDEGHVRGVGVRWEGLRARDVWALNKYFESPDEGGTK